MELNQVLSYIGTLGLGGVIGIFLQSFLEGKQAKKRMLFEARVKAYSGLTGRLTNLFQEPDINHLPDYLKFTVFNQLISEAMLVGSAQLTKLLSEFKSELIKLDEQMDYWVKDKSKYDEKMTNELYQKCVSLVGKVLNQMRKDIFIESMKWGGK